MLRRRRAVTVAALVAIAVGLVLQVTESPKGSDQPSTRSADEPVRFVTELPDGTRPGEPATAAPVLSP